VEVLAVEDLAVVAQADPVERAPEAAGRLAAEAQQPSLVNGSQPRRLSAVEFWVEFLAFPECPVRQAREG
jgi:hypothetical protein